MEKRSDGVLRTSNYFFDHDHLALEKQTFVNTNLRILDPDTQQDHVAEVQFYLQDFLAIKDIQHEYSERNL